jgi:hypothetical protein
MIVEALESRELEGTLERSALVRWAGGEVRLRTGVPVELAGDPDDASPFVPLVLLCAMQADEDLTVDAPVSPRLLRGAERARELWKAWSPRLRASSIEVAEGREARAAGSGEVACFLSRGVDSVYACAVPRSHPGPLSRLVFIDGFEHQHDERVRAEEIRRAGEMAARIGLPLIVASTNHYDLSARIVGNADDHTAPALALTALALAGLGAVVIPSSDRTQTLGPQGTSPALDEALCTEAVSLVHDSVALGRVEKCRWLARERRDLLSELKVCYSINSPGNCGRCGKCLLTMAALRAAGALDAAALFPDALDLDEVRSQGIRDFQARIEWSEVVRELDPGGDQPLREAILEALGRPLWPYPGPPAREDTPDFRRRHTSLLVSVLRDGRPWPPPEGLAAPPGVGLVRAVDQRRGRHVYGVGTLPAGDLAGELGALPRAAAAGLEPLYVTADGHLTTEGVGAAPRPAPLAATRWLLAPLAWRDLPLGPRLTALRWRLRWVGRARPHSEPSRLAAVGYLHIHDAPGRRPLRSSIHAVTGDQLLCTDAVQATDMGYPEPTLLGYLDAHAPLTGTLEMGRPAVPWASRFGQRVRSGH